VGVFEGEAARAQSRWITHVLDGITDHGGRTGAPSQINNRATSCFGGGRSEPMGRGCLHLQV
jgi:hypothetical protein